MDDNIIFRFKTRTRPVNGDYRVFSDGGQNVYPESEFSPIEDKSDNDDMPCAIMYCENKKIYVAAFGLQRGVKDFTNRPIMFSLCQIFTEWPSAWAAFARLIYNWHETEKFISSHIRECGKDVIFEQEKFISWLQENRLDKYELYTLNPDDSRIALSEIDANTALIPKNNCVLKWEEGNQEIYCFRPVVKGSRTLTAGKGFNGSDVRQGNKLFRKIVMSAAILVIIILTGIGTKFYLDSRKAKSIQVSSGDVLIESTDKDITAKTQELPVTHEDAKKFLSSEDAFIESPDKKINSPDFDSKI